MDSLRTDRDPSTWSVRTSNEQSIVLSTGVAAGPGSLSARPVAVRTDLVIMVVVHLDQSPFLADPRAHWTPLTAGCQILTIRSVGDVRAGVGRARLGKRGGLAMSPPRLAAGHDGGRPGRVTINLPGKIFVMIYAAPVPGGAHCPAERLGASLAGPRYGPRGPGRRRPRRVAVDDVLPAPGAANGRRAADGRAPVVRLQLRLPRQAESVGVARRVLDSVLHAMAIDQHCRDELLLALGEGCANVVQHAVGADGYEVSVSFDDDCCVVDILDNGRRAPQLPVNPSMPHAIEERGRGLSIMAMTTDSLQISPRQPHGLAVRFTKRLT